MLRMNSRPIYVRVFAAPDVSCGSGMTWSGASQYLAKRLKRRFGDRVVTEHIEIFSPRSFEFLDVMAAVQTGVELPMVTVGDRIASHGGKLSDRIIGQAVEALIAAEERD